MGLWLKTANRQLLPNVGSYLGPCISIFIQSWMFLLWFFRWTRVGQKSYVAVDDLATIADFNSFFVFAFIPFRAEQNKRSEQTRLCTMSRWGPSSSSISILVLWRSQVRCMRVLCDHTERVIYVICEAGSPYSYYTDIVVGWQSSAFNLGTLLLSLPEINIRKCCIQLCL